ncbi:anthranilate synthase component II [Nonlabens ponticola]|uniref:Aminodeoxychorismate/anthranilate synthase component II n=1 Tax=Nonlabens ponticola TaxID=2496866 RepID=A0A3S9N133_9FLAO|nr:aminodeoxychorismate/anthranilate synthase component II [Nonlabens ponticola]AZQ45052.1 aminodeoxychorismate/anthranilate synthase component II [Nonlabens ponticola]
MKKSPNILVVDNYDSFTYNLVHYLEDLEATVTVYRNDEIEPEDTLSYDAIVLSPGPGIPKEAGNLMDIIETAKGKVPLLGICLGHQAITESYGGTIINLDKVYHGIATTMTHHGSDLFAGIDEQFEAGRYHSWNALKSDFPKELEVTAIDEQGEIMALRHRELPIYGVQFHPESIMTPQGKIMLKNFLNSL